MIYDRECAVMLSLPWKPSRQVRITEGAKGSYTLTFVSRIENKDVFEKIIKNDLEVCLGKHDNLTAVDWKNKSVRLMTTDITSFKQKLIFRPIIIKSD